MAEMRRAFSLVVFSALMACATGAMAHGSSVSVLMVRAEVRPSAALKFEARTAQFALSAADLAQGYIEIPAAALLSLTAGRFRPLVFLDSIPLADYGGAYRLDLAGKIAPGRRVVPVTLSIEL
jgi:hypothetical protein